MRYIYMYINIYTISGIYISQDITEPNNLGYNPDSEPVSSTNLENI